MERESHSDSFAQDDGDPPDGYFDDLPTPSSEQFLLTFLFMAGAFLAIPFYLGLIAADADSAEPEFSPFRDLPEQNFREYLENIEQRALARVSLPGLRSP